MNNMTHPLSAPIERRLNKDTLLVPIERKLVPNLFREGMIIFKKRANIVIHPDRLRSSCQVCI